MSSYLRWIFKILVTGAILASSAAYGQSAAPTCQSRALKTVQEAKLRAIGGDNVTARKLLGQADSECGNSYAVLKGISQVYQQLGDSVMAAVYEKNSGRYSNQGGPSGGASKPTETAMRPQEKGFVRAKFALVVGVGQFQNPKIRKLKYSAKDANDFAAVLLDPNVGRFPQENVTVLTDSQATARAIRSALADIAAKAMKDDLVVLYFSTHGSSPSMEHSKVGSGYLVTYDTDATDLYATAYGMDELAYFIKQKISAERVVTFLDTCYSGDTTLHFEQNSGSKALEVDTLSEQSIGQIAQGKGSVVITSSTNRELSWESDEQHNSFFTLYLMQSMRDRGGLATVTQLFTDIQRKIPAAVRDYTRAKKLGENGAGATQHPEVYPRSDIPDIVIGTPTK
jgi:hypothetical protein